MKKLIKILNWIKNIFKRKSLPKGAVPLNQSALTNVLPVADPYVILIENTTDAKQKIEIFGANWNLDEPNFNNPEGIKITNLQTPDEKNGYKALLNQIQQNPVAIGKWRFASTDQKNMSSMISFWYRDANGFQCEYPLNLAVYKDAYQYQSDIADVTKFVGITGGLTVVLNLEPQSKLTLMAFPVEIMNNKLQPSFPALESLFKTTDVNSTERFDSPNLSGKNIAPIIIQTTIKDEDERLRTS